MNATQHLCFAVLKEPYEYLAAKLKKPPDDGFVSVGDSWLAIVCYICLGDCNLLLVDFKNQIWISKAGGILF